MGSIGRRLKVLEGRGDSCVVCGWGPGVEVEVVWDDGFDEVPEPEEPENCPACGRPDTIVITWGDEHEA